METSGKAGLEEMEWSHGLFECCAEPGGACLCLKSTFCPCVVEGEINDHINTFPGGFAGGCCGVCVVSCAVECLTAGIIFCVPCVASVMWARDIALLERREENMPMNIFKACCCCCCQLIQMGNQMELQKQRGLSRPPGTRLPPPEQQQMGTVVGAGAPAVPVVVGAVVQPQEPSNAA